MSLTTRLIAGARWHSHMISGLSHWLGSKIDGQTRTIELLSLLQGWTPGGLGEPGRRKYLGAVSCLKDRSSRPLKVPLPLYT